MNDKIIPKGQKKDIINAEVIKEIEASGKLIPEFSIEPFQISGEEPQIVVPCGKKIKLNAEGEKHYRLSNLDFYEESLEGETVEIIWQQGTGELQLDPLGDFKYVINLGEISESIRALVDRQHNEPEDFVDKQLFLRLFTLFHYSENTQVEVRYSFKDINRYIGNTEVIVTSEKEMTVEEFVFREFAAQLEQMTIYINEICVNDNLEQFDYIARYTEKGK